MASRRGTTPPARRNPELSVPVPDRRLGAAESCAVGPGGRSQIVHSGRSGTDPAMRSIKRGTGSTPTWRLSAAWQQVSRHLRPRGAGLIIVHCGACRRTVAHHAVISARRAASGLVGMCAETVPGARAPAARRSAGGEVGRDELGDLGPRCPRISGPRESV